MEKKIKLFLEFLQKDKKLSNKHYNHIRGTLPNMNHI